ncbi:MAG: NAD(P)/FAD-dependent oxidoreductase [Pararhizobium sp.]
MSRISHYDVIVVGGRCAGAATAMLLARAGARTLVIDRQAYGSDTLSTHALMKPAVLQLARWGLLDAVIAAGAPVIGKATFHYGEETVPVAIRPEAALPGLVAPRRAVLDRILIDAARKAGADVVHDTSVVDLDFDRHGRVSGVLARHAGRTERLRAGFVVGADGIGSIVARSAPAAVRNQGKSAAATIYGYAALNELDGHHWYFTPGLSAGAIPTNDGEACIFVAAPQSHYDAVLRFDRANCHQSILEALAPDLAHQVACGGIGALRTFRGRAGFIRQAVGPGWMLVGDAGFFRDPITSHGISDAFRDAEAAAIAVLGGSQWDMQGYQDGRDAFAYPLFEATEAIAAFDWTLDEAKEHHKRLSAIMKAEVAELCRRQHTMPIRSAPSPAPACPEGRPALLTPRIA